MKKILVPVDFTELSEKVIEQAAFLCSKSNSVLVLFHIAEKPSEIAAHELKIQGKAAATASKYQITCESLVKAGSIFKDIHTEVEENDYMLVVIGTHGVRGLKQKLLGADILKVIMKVRVPVLVVQSTSPDMTSFDKIILPVATHNAYENILHAVVFIGKLFHSQVHIYSVERPGFEWPESLKNEY